MNHEPDELTYWLECLNINEQWEEAWADTYDWTVSNWQLDVCWRLLRVVRRLAHLPAQQALVRYRGGRLYAQTGEWQRAAASYEVALANVAADGNELQLSLLSEMGMLSRLRGAHQEAEAYHQRQYELAKTIGDVWHQAEALEQIGLDYEAAGRLADAQQNLQLALQLWSQLDINSGLASAHKHLGLVTWRQGKLAAAEQHLLRARDLALTAERLYDLAQIEGNLGNLAFERAQLDTAEAHYITALKYFDELGVVFDKIGILNNLAGVALAREQDEQTRTWYSESLALSQMLGHRPGELDALLNLSVAALQQQRWAVAPALYQQALAVARSLNNSRAVWAIRRRQLRFFVLYALLRSLSWLRDLLGTKQMEEK
jgi:tetratricopeptide (TPR) repeat protein